MTYDDFIASNPKESGFGMFTEEANNKVKTMIEKLFILYLQMII